MYIQNLKPGDVVVSYDPATGKLYPNVIERLLIYLRPYTYLIDGEVGADAAEVFYTQRGWVAAENLVVGDRIFNPLTKSWIVAESMVRIEKAALVYDAIGSSSNNLIVDSGYLADVNTNIT